MSTQHRENGQNHSALHYILVSIILHRLLLLHQQDLFLFAVWSFSICATITWRYHQDPLPALVCAMADALPLPHKLNPFPKGIQLVYSTKSTAKRPFTGN